MKKFSTNLSDNMEGFNQKKVDYSNYETSFRRWLIAELDSGRMSVTEAREKFNLPHRFDKTYKHWQVKYSDENPLIFAVYEFKRKSR